MPRRKKTKRMTVDGLQKWMDNLKGLNHDNFITLISLPNALEIIGKCPEGVYKEAALLALAIRKRTEDK